jgi:hypothetical protein
MSKNTDTKTCLKAVRFVIQSIFRKIWYSSLIILIVNLLACQTRETGKTEISYVRPIIDTVGFAQYSWQMDSLMSG